MTAWFITATGTDVGKTFVTQGLVRALRRQGDAVEAYKPVASGFDMATAETSDPGVLLTALGRAVTQAELDRIAPWRFAAPLSPDMAARREGRGIAFDDLIAFSKSAVRPNATVLIEGVGGIMVPLDDRHTVLDWMTALAWPAIVVAGSYLGTISHTLSALDVLARRGVKVAAVVVCETPGSTVALDETTETIARFAAGIEVLSLPRLPDAASDHTVFRTLAARTLLGAVR